MDYPAHSTSLRGPERKACANCARVKSKCITRSAGDGCERCHRLNKPCVPSAPAKRRGPKSHGASRSTPASARLEKKLDDLMSLMRLQQAPVHLPNVSPQLLEAGHDDDDGNETSPTLTNNTPTAFQPDIYADEPSLEEAEATFRRFRDEMVPLCPYVYIPNGWDATTLRQQYPFLWLSIMSVASLSTKTRYSLGRQVKNIIVQKIVADGTRSVDMLLGVLTFLCWMHLLPMDKLFGSMVSQIAVALIHDLGLNMTPPEYPSKVGQLLNGKGFGLLPQIRKERTMEDRRALIGAYIITSMTCHAFRSADGLCWSTYLDECLNYVSQNSTEPYDHILVTQAKLQLIVNRLRSAYRGSSSVQVPAIYSDALRSELDSLLTLTDGVSNIFDNNSTMKRLYHFSMLMAYESLLNKSSVSHDKDMQNFAYYQRVVNSLHSWLDLYFSIPLDHLRFLPASNYSQLYYVTVFIYRIAALKVPTWNSLLAEAGAELVPVLDTVIQRFEQAALSMPDSQTDQAFLLGIHKFSALKAVFKSEFGSSVEGENGASLLPQDAFMSMSEAGGGTPQPLKKRKSMLLDSEITPASSRVASPTPSSHGGGPRIHDLLNSPNGPAVKRPRTQEDSVGFNEKRPSPVIDMTPSKIVLGEETFFISRVRESGYESPPNFQLFWKFHPMQRSLQLCGLPNDNIVQLHQLTKGVSLGDVMSVRWSPESLCIVIMRKMVLCNPPTFAKTLCSFHEKGALDRFLDFCKAQRLNLIAYSRAEVEADWPKA